MNDVEADPLTAEAIESWRAVRTRSVVNVPVRDRGRTAALLIVNCEDPHAWTDEEVAFVRAAADRLETAIDRAAAARQQALLTGELSHRLKNTLGMVQAIALQTLRGADDQPAVAAFVERLKALSAANDVLVERGWSDGALLEVARSALSTFDGEGRVSTEGPALTIGPRAAMSLSLLLHELATNATKYGALSVPAGKVTLFWSIAGEGDARTVDMSWSERGGPPAVEPTRRGFGSRIIRLGLVGSGGVNARYGSEGVTVEMTAPLYQMQQS